MTSRKKKLLSGILAMTVGLSIAMPMRALADDWDHDHDRPHHHHMWSREHDDDDYRAYPRQREDDDYWIYRNRALPPNGQGMINQRNPNFVWACDSDGHHCHWARRGGWTW